MSILCIPCYIDRSYTWSKYYFLVDPWFYSYRVHMPAGFCLKGIEWRKNRSTEHSIPKVHIFENNMIKQHNSVDHNISQPQKPLMDSPGLWLWTLHSQVLVACPTFSRGKQRWASDKLWSISQYLTYIWSACMHMQTHILPECLQTLTSWYIWSLMVMTHCGKK